MCPPKISCPNAWKCEVGEVPLDDSIMLYDTVDLKTERLSLGTQFYHIRPFKSRVRLTEEKEVRFEVKE